MPTTDTHVVMHNGGERASFLSDTFRPHREQIRRLLDLLDGDDRWALSIFRAPQGVGILDIDLRAPRPLLQIGGSADAMTIEVFYIEDDGNQRLYTVGKPGGDYVGEPTVEIRRQKNRDLVYPNEVFTADEATDVAYAFYLADRVPDSYFLRRFDLTWPKNEAAE